MVVSSTGSAKTLASSGYLLLCFCGFICYTSKRNPEQLLGSPLFTHQSFRRHDCPVPQGSLGRPFLAFVGVLGFPFSSKPFGVLLQYMSVCLVAVDPPAKKFNCLGV